MAGEPKLEGLRNWLGGQRKTPPRFSDLWRLVLILISDRATRSLDEEKQEVPSTKNYSYDVALVAEEEGLFLSYNDLHRIASYFEQHGWATITRRNPVKLAITAEGRLQAERILLDFAVIRRAPEKQIFSETDPPYVTEVPAADRYVFLNDNSTTFRDAVLSLESLVTEIAATRVNDWPEKEGILAAANAVLEMIKTKWVNKATVLAAISSLATFIVSKFAEAPISELANKAWAAVKALF